MARQGREGSRCRTYRGVVFAPGTWGSVWGVALTLAACSAALRLKTQLSTLEAFQQAREQTVSGILPTMGPPHGYGGAPQDGGCRGRTTPHHGASTAPASRHGLLREPGLQAVTNCIAPQGDPCAQEVQGWGRHPVWPQSPRLGALRFLCRTQGGPTPREALGLMLGLLARDPESRALGPGLSQLTSAKVGVRDQGNSERESGALERHRVGPLAGAASYRGPTGVGSGWRGERWRSLTWLMTCFGTFRMWWGREACSRASS